MMTPVNRDNRAGKVLVNPARTHSFPLFLSIGALCENARFDFRNAGLRKHSGVHGPIEEDLSRLLHAAVKSYFRPAPALSFSLSLCAARTHATSHARVSPSLSSLVVLACSNNLIYSYNPQVPERYE